MKLMEMGMVAHLKRYAQEGLLPPANGSHWMEHNLNRLAMLVKLAAKGETQTTVVNSKELIYLKLLHCQKENQLQVKRLLEM